MLKLADIPRRTALFQKLLGEKLVHFIRMRVQNMRTNFKLQTYNPYSESYAQRKSEGKAAPKGVPQSSWEIKPPDMTLTGKTMASLKVFEFDKKSFIFGWIGFAAQRVRDLHKIKNYRIVGLEADNPLSSLEDELIHKAYIGDSNRRVVEYEREAIIFKLEF